MSSVPRDAVQISRSKADSLHRTPAGFTVLALDGSGLCDILPARPTSAASYPISVRRVATLLHASFRRSLAVPPLRFASASPPSGCTGDFHPQTAGHAQHTGRFAPRNGARWPLAILDCSCARRLGDDQAGTRKRPPSRTRKHGDRRRDVAPPMVVAEDAQGTAEIPLVASRRRMSPLFRGLCHSAVSR